VGEQQASASSSALSGSAVSSSALSSLPKGSPHCSLSKGSAEPFAPTGFFTTKTRRADFINGLSGLNRLPITDYSKRIKEKEKRIKDKLPVTNAQ